MKKIKIVDLSTLIPGPFASYLLAKNLECEVVKIEDANSPDPLINMRPTKNGVGLGYESINKIKKVLKVDFRTDGIESIIKEVKDANVLIENFKSGRAYKLGISYEDLLKVNPHLIVCSISGYKKGTSLEGKSAHDLNILALSGYLDQQYKLNPDSFLPPLLVGDTFTSYKVALSILSAIIKDQLPVHLQISMYESLLEAMTINNIPLINTKREFDPDDFLFSGNLPCYSVYESKDDRKIAVAALEKPLWIDFCTHLNREDLIEKQFEPEAKSEVLEEMKKYDFKHWLGEDFDFCVTPILSINEAASKKYV